MIDNDFVWYASYGSNMNRDRFLCYIFGGTPKGSTQKERGCRDKILPKKERAYILNYQMYFSKISSRWNGGVAFIGLDKSCSYATYSYMYLLSKEQFEDIVSQENNIENTDIDLYDVVESGSKKFRDSWYGNIVYIGDCEGDPVFTFTSTQNFKLEEARKPSKEYLFTIIIGLKREIGLNEDQILDYLKCKPGIKGVFSNGELRHMINEA